MNLIERRRSLLVFTIICMFVAGMFFLILANRDNISMATNTGHSHSWGAWVTISTQTCSTPEIRRRTCTYPGCTAYDEYTQEATGVHSWVGPTCGNSQYCSVCGATGAPATGNHSYTWVTTTPATCGSAGVSTGTCKVCGAKSTKPIAKTSDHTWGEWMQNGIQGHIRTCNICGVSESKGHTPGAEATCTTAQTCTVCKYVLQAASGHSFSLTTHGPDYLASDKTCSEYAKYYYKCQKCPARGTETWDYVGGGKLDHDKTQAAGEVATCGKNGFIEWGCTRCTWTETEILPATNDHEWGYWENLNTSGHKRTCEICDRTETEQHTWGKWQTEKAATCGIDGSEVRLCSTCGNPEVRPLAATENHSWSAWRKVKMPTCKATGLETRICGACNKTETRDIPISTDHNYKTTYKYNNNGTHTGTMTCSVCGKETSTGTANCTYSSQATCGSASGPCIACESTKPATGKHKYETKLEKNDNLTHNIVTTCSRM